MDNILTLLSQRDEITDQTGSWEMLTKASDEIIRKIPVYKKLNEDVTILKKQLDDLETEIENNTEFAQKSREIKSLKDAIASENEKISQKKEEISLLTQEISNQKERYDPLEKEITELRAKHNDLKTTIDSLNEELKNKTDSYFYSKTSFDTITSQYAQLQNEETKLINQLMRLKQREVDLRNEDVIKAPTPTIDMSQFKVELPRSQNDTNDDMDHEDDLDISAIQRKDFLSTLTQETNSTKHRGSVTAICFANTQPYCASGSEDSTVTIVKTDTFARHANIQDATKTIMAINFSPSDQLMLTASYDKGVRFYKLPDFRIVETNSANHDCVNDACFITDERFVTAARDQTIKLFDLHSSSPVYSITASSTPSSIFPLQGESLVVAAHYDGCVRGYDLRTHGVAFQIQAHRKSAMQICGKPGANKIVSLSEDKTVAVMDVRVKAVVGSVNILEAGMPSQKMQMALVDSSALCGSTSGDIFDYDLSTYKLRGHTRGHQSPVFCVAAKQSLGLLATGDKSGVVKFWNH